ncbi:c-type cytochrome [Thalassotalea sediminis]|uniref:c-type cytochrome n=1 Tax=Thalassotalea sediminis TaxID=1759089 RepID=UPI0025741AB5|nr:c-type cytochrome [Thalassotalea sediminis]
MYRFILSSLYCTSLLALIASLPLLAKETPKAYAQCIACHGENGEGNAALSSPAIAGLSEQYLSRQLKNYASGKRGYESADSYGQQMAAISKSLDLNKDVPELAKYIATLPKPTIEQKVSGDLKNGHRYYHAKCGACHGGQGQGNSSFKAPKLAGQHFDYLARQMQNFSQGMRGKHPDDKYGRQMAMMARTVSDKELADILFFISQQ